MLLKFLRAAYVRVIGQGWSDPFSSFAKKIFPIGFAVLGAWLALFCQGAFASDDMLVFSEQLNNGWQDWGVGWLPHYFTNNSAFPASNAILATPTDGWEALYFEHDNINTALYTDLTLWLNGGASGGQSIGVSGLLNGTEQSRINVGINGKAPTNFWLQVTLSLASMGLANQTNLDGIEIWNNSANPQSNFMVAGISLVAAPKPAVVHVGVNATKIVRSVDARLFSANTAGWDGDLDTPSTVSVLNGLNNQALRWPGGSWGDVYHFTNEYQAFQQRGYGCVTTNFIHVATNTHAQVYFIVNYGTAATNEAVDWVNFFNKTNHCYCQYWEIGNEIFGGWEDDSNTNLAYFGQEVAHDPWTYAMRFKDFYRAMKAADPTIKIGAVALPDETSYANNTNHPAVNPVTGATNNGWTAVMLNTMRTNGVTPDFLIEHKYAPGDGDTCNLLWTSTWVSDAAALRLIVNDYLGASVATNIELVDTEFGPEADKQWISLVGGLYYADSIGQVLQTEFNALLWWDLRNGQSVVTNSDNALYGWRTNSSGYYLTDEGIVNGTAVPPNRYPSYYCMELLQHFARGGDKVVTATNDYELLGTYAVQRTNGSLTLLVINKSSSSNLTAILNFRGWLPATNATICSYGIPQDAAAETGIGSPDIQTNLIASAGINFTNTFPPYSASVLVFNPAPPPTLALPNSPPGKFVCQLQGQPGARYVMETCTNLNSSWGSSSTNTLSGFTQNFTNDISGGQQFWRAVWLP